MRLSGNRISAAAVLAAATALTPATAFAINITPTSDAFGLANTLFLNVGGLTVNDASYSGAFGQAGTYQNPQGTYGLPVSGIALSTGDVSEYGTGENDAEILTSGSYGSATATADQEALLQPITGQGSHYDVAQLDVAFQAPDNISSVTFFGTFGSEEFPDYVGSAFIDGFGLYANGENVAGAVPSTGGAPQAININHPDMQTIGGTELNGVLAPNDNPVLRFDIPVNAGTQNEFQVILGDASDSGLDTTVYLSSFIASPGNGGNPGGGGGTNTGETEFDPLLPSNPPDPDTGAFVIELPEVPEDTTVWVDPPVAVGYEYETDGPGFTSITAPSLATVADTDGYMVTADGTTVSLGAGAMLDLVDVFGAPVTSFVLDGINPALMLDPGNTLAFPLGVSFAGVTNGASLTITPIVEDYDDVTPPIPLPATGLLYGGGLLFGSGALAWRRRTRA